MIGTLCVLGLFVGRAFQLQAFDAQAYAEKAADQMTRKRPLIPVRGTIADRNGVVMAATQPAVKVVADPFMASRNGFDSRAKMDRTQSTIAAQAPIAISEILAKHLGGSPEKYLALLEAKDDKGELLRYQVIAKQVPAATYQRMAAELRAGGKFEQDGKKYTAKYWFGVFKEDAPIREYPSGSVGGNLVGSINAQGEPSGGLEYSLNSALAGVPGDESYEAGAYGRVPLGNEVLKPAVNGQNFTLTIDSSLQQLAEASLAKGVLRAASKNGTAIVMNVKTGEVLAQATTPGYDPNNMSKVAQENLGNRSVTSPFEPGSVQKVVTMAMLADKAGISADSRVQVEGRYASGGGWIKDSFEHGTLHLTARGIIAKSSNVGMATLMTDAVDKRKVMTQADVVNYLKSFGLGARTGIELPGESAGVIPKPDMPQYQRDQISFGQGLSVTAIQEAAAVAAICNDGVYNPPTLLKSSTDGEGRAVELPAKQPHRVVSAEAAEQVQDMMESVITAASKTRAIEGYRTIGKSGTAERAGADGQGYKGNGFTATFALAAPAEDPQLLVYVVIDLPENGRQGSDLALPVANEIMKQALPRYGVLPSTTPAPDKPLEYNP